MPITPGALQRCGEDETKPCASRQETRDAVIQAFQWHYRKQEQDKLYHSNSSLLKLGDDAQSVVNIVVAARPAPRRVQSGPTCGLLALRMAMDSLLLSDLGDDIQREDITYLLLSAADLLALARKRGVSAHGEMFSAATLSRLAAGVPEDSEMFEVSASSDEFLVVKEYQQQQNSAATVDTSLDEVQAVVSTGLRSVLVRWWQPLDVVRFLSEGGLVLIPYDNDKNNTPCKVNGRLAHWCTVIGVAVPTRPAANSFPESEQRSTFNVDIVAWQQAGNRSREDEQRGWMTCSKEAAVAAEGGGEIHFIIQQSRSTRLFVWSASDLCESNRQLREPAAHRQTDAVSGSCILPPSSDLSRSLSGFAIAVFATEQNNLKDDEDSLAASCTKSLAEYDATHIFPWLLLGSETSARNWNNLGCDIGLIVNCAPRHLDDPTLYERKCNYGPACPALSAEPTLQSVDTWQALQALRANNGVGIFAVDMNRPGMRPFSDFTRPGLNEQLVCDMLTHATSFLHCIYEANAIADKSNDAVLVHCVAGEDRSATIIVAYLMRFGIKSPNLRIQVAGDLQMELGDAITFVKQKRAVHISFLECLSLWEHKLRVGLTAATIPADP